MIKISWLFWGVILFLLVSVTAVLADIPDRYTSEDCIDCHQSESEESSLLISIEDFSASVHGQVASCTDCHIDILDDSHMDDGASQVIACNQCHPRQFKKAGLFSRFTSYRIASHPKADFATAYEKENCLGCHQGTGKHGETEPINDQNCYQCHTPKGEGALWGDFHTEANKGQPFIILYGCLSAICVIALLSWFLGIFNCLPGRTKKVEGDQL